jgi:hypothetical protein
MGAIYGIPTEGEDTYTDGIAPDEANVAKTRKGYTPIA